MTQDSLRRRVSELVGAAFLLVTSTAFADHGGSTHLDLGLVVPATSSTGNYTVTWNGTAVQLQEKVGSGNYATVATGGPKSFTNKPDGTYTYRNYFQLCIWGCVNYYSLPQSNVVGVPATVSLFASLEALVQTEFSAWMTSEGATNSQRLAAEADIVAIADTILQEPTNRATHAELVVIHKIRVLQNIYAPFQQNGIPTTILDLIEQYNFESAFPMRGDLGEEQ